MERRRQVMILPFSGQANSGSPRRASTRKTLHGTGCSLSSAIAANLAKGMVLADAVSSAKRWLSGAIAASGRLDVGKGHGPVHHFHNLLEE
ncbi:MAG: bifunctional hydroxymethylpyrimidine kinase/phosphomethylpyrimidine kinase [Nitratireductor sp.]